MKNSTKLALIGAVLAAGALQTYAVTATNYDVAISFALTQYTPGAKTGTAVTTKSLLSALNGDKVVTGTGTNAVTTTLSWTNATAKLVSRQVLSTNGLGSSDLYIVTGSGKTLGSVAVNGAFLTNYSTTSVTLTNGTKATKYSLPTWTIVLPTGTYSLSGVGVTTKGFFARADLRVCPGFLRAPGPVLDFIRGGFVRYSYAFENHPRHRRLRSGRLGGHGLLQG